MRRTCGTFAKDRFRGAALSTASSTPPAARPANPAVPDAKAGCPGIRNRWVCPPGRCQSDSATRGSPARAASADSHRSRSTSPKPAAVRIRERPGKFQKASSPDPALEDWQVSLPRPASADRHHGGQTYASRAARTSRPTPTAAVESSPAPHPSPRFGVLIPPAACAPRVRPLRSCRVRGRVAAGERLPVKRVRHLVASACRHRDTRISYSATQGPWPVMGLSSAHVRSWEKVTRSIFSGLGNSRVNTAGDPAIQREPNFPSFT